MIPDADGYILRFPATFAALSGPARLGLLAAVTGLAVAGTGGQALLSFAGRGRVVNVRHGIYWSAAATGAAVAGAVVVLLTLRRW